MKGARRPVNGVRRVGRVVKGAIRRGRGKNGKKTDGGSTMAAAGQIRIEE